MATSSFKGSNLKLMTEREESLISICPWRFSVESFLDVVLNKGATRLAGRSRGIRSDRAVRLLLCTL